MVKNESLWNKTEILFDFVFLLDCANMLQKECAPSHTQMQMMPEETVIF